MSTFHRACHQPRRCCQINQKSLRFALARHSSGRAQLTPLDERGGATVLEYLSAGVVAFLVEMIADRAVHGGKFLQTSHPPEPEHRQLPSSEGQMTVLSPIIKPTAGFALVDRAERIQGSAVGSQPVGDNRFRMSVTPKQCTEEFQSRLLVPGLRDEALQHFAFVIDGAPQIVFNPVDLDENFVEMPPPMAKSSRRVKAISADLRSGNRPEPVPPEPHRLMRDVDPTIMKQVFHIPQRKRIADIHHHRQPENCSKIFRNGSPRCLFCFEKNQNISIV